MAAVAMVFGLVAGILHVGFWLMEAVWWRQPRIWKRFGARSQEEAETMAFGMLNQGYYNLFLGLGAIAGAILIVTDVAGRAILLGYSCLFMLGAAVVLGVARRSMLRAAFIQGGPPAIALIAVLLV